MFKFIKNLFNKELPLKEIPLEKLINWFANETQDRLEAIKAEVKVIFTKIEGEKDKLHKTLYTLERADLKNLNVSIREKQLMEGNRFAYLKKMKNFLEAISIEKDVKVKEFCENFGLALVQLNKSTSKSYYVLKEFFANYTTEIAQTIRALETSIKSLRELFERPDMKLIESTNTNISELLRIVALEKEIIGKNQKLQHEIKDIESEKQKIIKKIEEAKESEEFKEIKKLEGQYQDTINSIKLLKEPILQDFSILEAALKKYERITLDDELVSSYIEKPITTLKADKEMKIMQVLTNIHQNIENNQIELKDKKKEKILRKIESIDSQSYEEFLKKYNTLCEEKQEQESLMQTKKIRTIILTLQKEIDLKESKIQELTIELEKSSASKIDPNPLKEQIQKDMQEITNLDIQLVL